MTARKRKTAVKARKKPGRAKARKKAVKKAARPSSKPARKAAKVKPKSRPAKKPAERKTLKTAGRAPAKPAASPAQMPSTAKEKPKKRAGVTDIGETRKDAEFEVKIQNIVAFTDLGTKISLEKVLQTLENTEYQPEQFPGLIYRMQSPRASALVFSQGKIVCTGTKSMAALKEAMENIVKNLRSVGFRLPKKYVTTVENIVASSSIDADLNLDEIAFQLENSEYEPEQFPGLVYRISQPRVAFLLFKSGRIIITGGRTIDDIHEALGIFKSNLEAIGVKLKPSKSKEQ